MKTILVANDLWELVANEFTNVTDPNAFRTLSIAQKNQLKETRKNDAKALSLIEVALIEAIFSQIATTSYAKEAWEILQNNYKGTDKVRLVKLQLLRREFETL